MSCPHLGLFSDPQTLIANADPRNYCHMVFPPRAVFISHQETYCLKKNFKNCEVFICEGIGLFPELLVEDADTAKKSGAAAKKTRARNDKNDKLAVKAAAAAGAAATIPSQAKPEAADDGWNKNTGYLDNQIIGAQERIDANTRSRPRQLILVVTLALVLGLLAIAIAFYQRNARLQSELISEREFANTLATSAYDIAAQANAAQLRSTNQAATVTVLSAQYQSQSTAQVATMIALTAAVTPTAYYCLDLNSVSYEILDGPKLVPPAGSVISGPPPGEVQAIWQVKNSGPCAWHRIGLWSLSENRILTPEVQRGGTVLALTGPNGEATIAPGESVEIILKLDPLVAQNIESEIVLMINDLSMVEKPRFNLVVTRWLIQATSTAELIPTQPTEARPTNAPPPSDTPEPPPRETSPPPTRNP